MLKLLLWKIVQVLDILDAVYINRVLCSLVFPSNSTHYAWGSSYCSAPQSHFVFERTAVLFRYYQVQLAYLLVVLPTKLIFS
jgi:hypothetical protein